MSKPPEHIVHQGWMTKSPPENKLTSTWKFFRAKWKKRYFVLSKPAGSLPGQYLLSYFTDESCRRRKGVIDLEQCEQIIESLASEQFLFLLSIKTVHKNRERTYFLAPDSEEDMTSWVRCLCQVCGLKQEETPKDLPPQTTVSNGNAEPPPISIDRNSSTSSSADSRVQSVAGPVHNEVVNSPSGSSNSGTPKSLHDSSPYLYIANCHSGGGKNTVINDVMPSNTSASQLTPQSLGYSRQESLCSVPDEAAPSPPIKRNSTRTGSIVSGDDGGTRGDSTYDFPRLHDSDSFDDNLYKIPPRPSQLRLSASEQSYDIPPTHAKNASPRSSSSDSQTGDSAYSSDAVYKFPPVPRQCTPNSDNRLSLSEPYESPPPARLVEAPPRPPRHDQVGKSGRNVDNVLLNDALAANQLDQILDERDETYDIPPALVTPVLNSTVTTATTTINSCNSNVSTDAINTNNSSSSNTNNLLFSSPPPPPVCSNSVTHRYVNAAPGVLPTDDTNSVPPPPPPEAIRKDGYFAMNQSSNNSEPVNTSVPVSTVTTATNSVNLSAQPPPSSYNHDSQYLNLPCSGGGQTYTKMAGSGSRSGSQELLYTDMASTHSRVSNPYEHPPPCPRPINRENGPATAQQSSPPAPTMVQLVPVITKPQPPVVPPRPHHHFHHNYQNQQPTAQLNYQNQQPTAQPRSRGGSGGNLLEDDTYTIFSSERTRSFKKMNKSLSDLDVPKPAARSSYKAAVPLPSKKSPNIQRAPHAVTESTSSDEEVSQEDEIVINTSEAGRKPGLWRRTPPPPRRQESELKYLDLDLENQSDEPLKSPSLLGTLTSPTEYREIDFVKTQALSETKKLVVDREKTENNKKMSIDRDRERNFKK